jgi:hypothetical protein
MQARSCSPIEKWLRAATVQIVMSANGLPAIDFRVIILLFGQSVKSIVQA